ncbi:hypothetical protein [Bosea sp. NBC_00550]|uniref:hypothetical protein n=1 Tax=Bosea sp. NBC_00550 TaxID=2969621 RepID=UPI002231DE0C|nr:hypothetical protein [Bosea sp. NBC_00550]UZF91742.1 hypothetical protein NWE53_21945 [Bosea sp. NBC_00550]
MIKRARPVAYRHRGQGAAAITIHQTKQDIARLAAIRDHIETRNGCSVSNTVAVSMAIAVLHREATQGALSVRLQDFAKVPAAAQR